jgi:hypothetical protein
MPISPSNCQVYGTVGVVGIALLWTGCLAHQQEKATLAAPPPAPLPDRLHMMLPRFHGIRWVVHLMPVLLMAMVVAQLPLNRTLQLLQIYAVILFLRSFSFWVTRVPPPRLPCIPYSIGSRYLGGCSDMMYSGHTTVLVLSALFLAVYGTSRAVTVGAAVFAVVGILLILCTRHHYSSDVFVAIYISVFAFAAFTSFRQ